MILASDNAHLNSAQSQTLLLVYSIYRVGITLVLWVLFLADTGVGEQFPSLFISAGLIYLITNAILLLKSAGKWQTSFLWLLLIIASDIILLQLIAQSSGSIGSGLGVLMIVSVAAGSLFLHRKTALIVPAFATIALLSGVSVSVLQNSATKAEFVTSGWLGFIFFLASAFISYLAGRVESSEAIAAREHAHVKHLEHINSLIIERMQTGIVVVDYAGRIISHNQAAFKLLCNNADGRFSTLNDIDPAVQKYQQAIFSQLIHNALPLPADNPEPGTPFSMQLKKNGINIKLTWIKLEEQTSSEMLVFAEDLSKIAQQAQQLKLSSLGKLTASIAHEIRNPLGAVSHAAQLLSEQELSSQDERLSQIIIDQSKRCSNIIESVLDVSRGKASNSHPFDIAHWLPRFIKDYSIGKSCKVHLDIPATLFVRFDPAHLEQILNNLLNNAMRYSERQCDRNEALIKVYEDEDGRPRLEVYDLGPGVNAEDTNRLFEPFFTKDKTGNGLGLYICRELCEANQATIAYMAHCDTSTIIEKHGISVASHCFRLQFSHPDRMALSLKAFNQPNEITQ